MNENQISRIIVDAALHVHKRTGPGLLESVYEAVLAHELKKRGLKVQRQAPIPAAKLLKMSVERENRSLRERLGRKSGNLGGKLGEGKLGKIKRHGRW